MLVKEIQQKALMLIEFYRTHAWTKGQYARTAEGYSTSAQADDAVSWCMLGAMKRLGINSGFQDRTFYEALEAVSGIEAQENVDCYGVHHLNDRFLGTRDKVLEALRRVAKGGE